MVLGVQSLRIPPGSRRYFDCAACLRNSSRRQAGRVARIPLAQGAPCARIPRTMAEDDVEVASLNHRRIALEEGNDVVVLRRRVSRPRTSTPCCSDPSSGGLRIRTRSQELRAPLDTARAGKRGRRDGVAILPSTSRWRSGVSKPKNSLRRRRNPRPSADRARVSEIWWFPADCPHRTDFHCSPSHPTKGVRH